MAQPPVFTTRDAADPAFWDERFSRDHTPWDAHGVPAAFRQFCEAQPAPLSTLIPGCGNAYEAGWLAGRGWPVTAIDFAPSAVASAQAVLGPHAGVVELADFFRFAPRRPVQWIYERAFLCAMPRRLWADYAEQVARLLSPGGLLAGFFVVAAGQEASPRGRRSRSRRPNWRHCCHRRSNAWPMCRSPTSIRCRCSPAGSAGRCGGGARFPSDGSRGRLRVNGRPPAARAGCWCKATSIATPGKPGNASCGPSPKNLAERAALRGGTNVPAGYPIAIIPPFRPAPAWSPTGFPGSVPP